MAQVDDQTKVASVFNISYKDVQAKIKELTEKGDEQSLKTAEEYKKIPKDVFDLTPSQKRLQNMISYLQQQNMPDENIAVIITGMINRAMSLVIDQVESFMTPDLKAQWDEFMYTGPNQLQVFSLLNHFCEIAGKEDLDMMFDRNLNKVIDENLAILEQELRLAQLIIKLPEETIDKVNDLFTKGNYEEALRLIYKRK